MKKQYIKPVIRIPECDDFRLLAGSPRIKSIQWQDNEKIYNEPPTKINSVNAVFDFSDINNKSEEVTEKGLGDWYI